jgi:hypothetical protein
MTEQLAAGFGRQALAFDKGIVGNRGTQRLAPAQPFCMAWPVVATVMV